LLLPKSKWPKRGSCTRPGHPCRASIDFATGYARRRLALPLAMGLEFDAGKTWNFKE